MAMLAPNGSMGVERILKWQHHTQSLTWNSCFEWLACSACFTLVSIWCHASSTPILQKWAHHFARWCRRIVWARIRPWSTHIKGQHCMHVSHSTLSGRLGCSACSIGGALLPACTFQPHHTHHPSCQPTRPPHYPTIVFPGRAQGATSCACFM